MPHNDLLHTVEPRKCCADPFDAGRVVELGTPAVLLGRDGAYAALAA